MDIIDKAQEVSNDNVNDSISRIRSVMKAAPSGALYCSVCGGDIPEERRKLVPWTELCTQCQTAVEKTQGR